MRIQVDSTTERLIEHLLMLGGAEPPSGEEEVGAKAEEIAQTHYEWARQVNAVRLLIGVRLVNLALEEARKP